ncbi:YybS family protein [Oryzomonas japonica]|uniref:YybS family protein n=1 Tax=Oryzomonas japonica TaxID=2603858 RepID=A0A7J4ZPA2_9BACT|nr:YybS family protein [Oryzomonas japonica]KAB0664734.1 YybS family protein [Oryzomonas japonica]
MNPNTPADSIKARLTAVLVGTAGTFALFAVSFVLPPLGFFTGLLAPFPVVYYRLRQGRGTAAVILALAGIALTAVYSPNVGAIYLLQCGVIALLMPELLLRGHGAARTIAWTTGVSAALVAVVAVTLTLVSNQDLQQALSGEISTSISRALALYEKSGVKGDELSMVKKSMDMAAALLIRVYPSLVTILLGIMAGCNLALIRRPAFLMGYRFPLGDFKDLRLPEPLVWILIAAGFAMLAPSRFVTMPALNVLVVTTTLYFLQGLAVILTLTARQAFYSIIRVFLWVMLLIQPYLAAIVAAIGIFDLWGDFRTPKKQENL